jgi:RNA polymerase sigma-70 factor (ECF subfamily)
MDSAGDFVTADEFTATLEAAASGAEWAWEELYSHLAASLNGFLRTRGETNPEDLASETFIDMARHIRSFEGDYQSFRSWMFVTARRGLLDSNRAGSRRPTAASDKWRPAALADARHVAVAAIERATTTRAEDLLRELTPSQRDVLALRIIGNLTVHETAEVLGRMVGVVKVLQRSALTSVQRALSATRTPGRRPVDNRLPTFPSRFGDLDLESILNRGQSPVPELAELASFVAVLRNEATIEPSAAEVDRVARRAASITRASASQVRPPKGLERRSRLSALQAHSTAALAAVLVVASSGLGLVANAAVPGDLLYALDLTMEEVGIGDGSLQERVLEAQVLSQRGELAAAVDHLTRSISDTTGQATASDMSKAKDALDGLADIRDREARGDTPGSENAARGSNNAGGNSDNSNAGGNSGTNNAGGNSETNQDPGNNAGGNSGNDNADGETNQDPGKETNNTGGKSGTDNADGDGGINPNFGNTGGNSGNKVRGEN